MEAICKSFVSHPDASRLNHGSHVSVVEANRHNGEVQMNTTTATITACRRMALHLEVQRKAERKLSALQVRYARQGDLHQLQRAQARLRQIRQHLYN